MLSVKQNFVKLYRRGQFWTTRKWVANEESRATLCFSLGSPGGNRPVTRARTIGIIALRRAGPLPLEDPRMNAFAVTALTGLHDRVSTPHIPLFPFFPRIGASGNSKHCTASRTWSRGKTFSW